ncbi:hypothetical protein JTB14_009342 [Gonioctena quinquepunctata]|nr:hypothetical protein JTB14_009342 [Gonioctena quinquepunctata]
MEEDRNRITKSFIFLIQNSSASFIYGEPCSKRNTAYLAVETWIYPDHNVKCLDITGLKKGLISNVNISRYVDFFKEVLETDTLYSDHMNLTKFPISIVKNLPNLQMIDLTANNIARIPGKMFKLAPKLDKLLMSNNRVIIPKKKPLIASMTLRTLMLSNNEIKKIYKYTFMKLPALEVLYLDSNNLKTIAPLFASVPSLKYLHVGRNFLTNIPPKTMISRSLNHYITKSQRNYIEKRSHRLRHHRRNAVFSLI